MNKKGIAFKSLIYLMIGLIVLFFVFYLIFSPKGLKGITDIGVKLGLSKLPETSKEELKETEKVPDEIRISFYDLVNAIKDGKENKNSNCLIKYNIFPDSIKDFNINIKKIDEGLSLTTYNRLGQLELQETIPDLESCYYNKLNGPNFNEIIISKNKINEKNYYSVTILGENYKLLYKDNSNNICFITECDNDCLQDLMFDNKIDFCDVSYKDMLINIYDENKGTFYGNVRNWGEGNFDEYGNLINYRYYIGYDGDSRVAFIFRNTGLRVNKFKEIFDISKVKEMTKPGKGVYYEGEYYGLKEDWESKKYDKNLIDFWGIDAWKIGEETRWFYTGNDPLVDEKFKFKEGSKGIDSNLKYKLFGEIFDKKIEVKDITGKKLDVDLIGIHLDISKKLNLKFTEEFEKEVREWEAKFSSRSPKSKSFNPETGEYEHMSFEKYASFHNFEEERADAKSAAEYILKDSNKGEKVESLLNELKPFYYGGGYVSKAEKSEINLYNLKEAYEVILKYLNPAGEEIEFSYNKEESYMGQLAKEMVNTYRPGICQDKASTIITFLKIAGYDVVAYPYPFVIGEYGSHMRVLVKIDNVWIALDPTIYPEKGFVPLFP